jgi:predicted metalloprotease
MMKFNPRAKIDRSQIQDRRGQGGRRGGGLSGLPGLGRGGGGGGLPIPTGGGIGGIVVVVIIVVLGVVFGGDVLGGGSSDQAATLSDCNDGTDADQQDCRIAIDVNAIQAFWTDALPQQSGVDYQVADTVYLAGSTSTGCGQATSAMGPFYCPNDTNVYLDLTFFQDMLQGQLGASGGEFQEA